MARVANFLFDEEGRLMNTDHKSPKPKSAALGAGGRDNGAPGPRPHYHEHYYGAFVLDPDGHNIEVVCHEPVPAPPGRTAAG